MPRALIFGHTGQDGRLLWNRLGRSGFELAGVSRTETIGIDGSPCALVDVADPLSVSALVRRVSPDQVYYLAAHHQSSQDSLEESGWHASWAVHVHGLQNVLEAVADTKSAASIFYAASSRIFGPGGGLRNEDSPRRPECPYGLTKAAGMMLASYYRTTRALRVSSGILFNHESPLRSQSYVSQRIVQGLVAIKQGRARSLTLGSLAARVDWGYAPDYVEAMQLIQQCDEPDDFVVASGTTHSVQDFVEVAATHLDIDWRQHVKQSDQVLTRAPQGLCGDPSRLTQSTGWRPRTGFNEMVRILVDHALAAGA